MRPDVAAAFDRMAASASRAGLVLVVSSGFRSDAEQAALFAANPDPRWVAPPGRSLHRCATELDLGPPSAYGWLAANASRFGFVQRYSWEAWHYGFAAGPAPCSAAGNSIAAGGRFAAGGGDGALSGAAGLPSFVPVLYRAPLLQAASRWNVSAALLAAQLMAESNFNPYASSPAGAQGIAQFIPSTAAAYGLRDPFDPDEAIDAQAHLMSDLLRQFGAPSLALAAYNAGPAPVEDCSCVPGYPETQAYVSRILALLDGAGALAIPAFEVRLVA
jgi:soluble lytic murein transglycosylase-like protein